MPVKIRGQPPAHELTSTTGRGSWAAREMTARRCRHGEAFLLATAQVPRRVFPPAPQLFWREDP